jgi:hypothetical protein
MHFFLVVGALGTAGVLFIIGLRMLQQYRGARLLRLAGEAAERGALHEAGLFADQALERTSDSDARVLAARIHHLSGNDDAAVRCLERERRITARLLATQVLLMQGRTAEASDCLDAIAGSVVEERHQLTQAGLLGLLHARRGDSFRCRAAVKTTCALMLRTGERSSRFDAQLNVARAYRLLGDAQAARAAAAGALNLALHPIERHQARQLLASCLDALGNRDAGRRWHKKVVEDGIESRFTRASYAALSA